VIHFAIYKVGLRQAAELHIELGEEKRPSPGCNISEAPGFLQKNRDHATVSDKAEDPAAAEELDKIIVGVADEFLVDTEFREILRKKFIALLDADAEERMVFEHGPVALPEIESDGLAVVDFHVLHALDFSAKAGAVGDEELGEQVIAGGHGDHENFAGERDVDKDTDDAREPRPAAHGGDQAKRAAGRGGDRGLFVDFVVRGFEVRKEADAVVVSEGQ